MSKRADIAGQTFGEWTVIAPSSRRRYWLCSCTCGTSKDVFHYDLTGQRARSCGCARGRLAGIGNTTHGLSQHRIYRVWRAMINRCHNPRDGSYGRYGGAGVAVCQRWLGKGGFSRFIEDMGMPADGMSIDRIDNDQGYRPGNCRWIPLASQSANRRCVTLFEGVPITRWMKERGICHSAIYRQCVRDGITKLEALRRRGHINAEVE